MASTLAIPKGSLVLISGGTGFVGSWIADEFVKQGYKVRGTARNEDKAAILKETIEKKYGSNTVEIAIVKDWANPEAYDEAIKGVSAVVHVASDVSFEADPKKVIPSVVNATKALLDRAKKETSIKRFVITSSSVASGFAEPASGRHYGPQSWNLEALRTSDQAQSGLVTYAASKVAGEQTFWEGDAPFTRNAVLPNLVLGPALHDKLRSSTHTWPRDIYKGEGKGIDFVKMLGPQYYINVHDNALLHVGATIFEDVEDQRLLGFAGKYSFNRFVDTMQQFEPDRKLPEKIEEAKDTTTANTRDSLQVLKMFGQNGWTSFEETLKANIA